MRRVVVAISMVFFLAILMMCVATTADAQQQLERDQVSGLSAQVLTYNVKLAAATFTFEYVLTGSPASSSIVLQGCMRGGTCDTLETNTSTSNSKRTVQGVYDYFTFAPTFSGGSSPKLTVNVTGMVGTAVAGATQTTNQTVTSRIVGNTGAVLDTSDGGTPPANMLATGMKIPGAFTYLYGAAPSSDGTPPGSLGYGLYTSSLGFGFNGTNFDRLRDASLANFPTAATSTAVNSIGAQVVENGSRWSKVSTPSVSTQATASIAAEASVRHVATGVCFSAGSTTAPALTQLTVNLRDGATGAGTVVASWTVIIPAATGQNVAPTCFPVGPFVGTTNTAMTLEFSALLTNLFENVTLSGYNVN